jgi:serine/threonine protein kinase
MNAFAVILRSWKPQVVPDFSPTASDVCVGRTRHPGRSDMTINCPYISSKHCDLTFLPPDSPLRRREGVLCVLKDTSRNGVWVNDRKVLPGVPTHLRAGDRLLLSKAVADPAAGVLGRVCFTFTEVTEAPDAGLEPTSTHSQYDLAPPSQAQAVPASQYGASSQLEHWRAEPLRQSAYGYTTPAALLRATGELHGDYIVDGAKELGRGSYSRVWLVQSRVTGEFFAAKEQRKAPAVSNCARAAAGQSIDALAEERAALKLCRHPNLMTLVDSYVHKGTPWLILELATGGDLFDKTVKKKRFEERHAAPLFRQLLRGMAYLHRQGIVHRDIKPENIFLQKFLHTPEGGGAPSTRYLAKIGDFGFARRQGHGKRLGGRLASMLEGGGGGGDAAPPLPSSPSSASSFSLASASSPHAPPRLPRLHSVVGTENYLCPEVMLLHAKLPAVAEVFDNASGCGGAPLFGTLWLRGVGPIWELPEDTPPWALGGTDVTDAAAYAMVTRASSADRKRCRAAKAARPVAPGGGGGAGATAVHLAESWSGDTPTAAAGDLQWEGLYVSAAAVAFGQLHTPDRVGLYLKWAAAAKALLHGAPAEVLAARCRRVRAPRREHLEQGVAGVPLFGSRHVGWAVDAALLPPWARAGGGEPPPDTFGDGGALLPPPPPSFFSPAAQDLELGGARGAATHTDLARLGALDDAQEYGYCGYAYDSYSLGCVLYVLLSGRLIMRESAALLERLRCAVVQRVEFPHDPWAAVSPEARHLILCLTAAAPGDRLTPYQALFHPWMQGRTLEDMHRGAAVNPYAYPRFAGLDGGVEGAAVGAGAPPRAPPPPPPQQQQTTLGARTPGLGAARAPAPAADAAAATAKATPFRLRPPTGTATFPTSALPTPVLVPGLARLAASPPVPAPADAPPAPPASHALLAVEELQRLGLRGEEEARGMEDAAAAELWALEDSFVQPPSSFALMGAPSPQAPACPEPGGKRSRGEQPPAFPAIFSMRGGDGHS